MAINNADYFYALTHEGVSALDKNTLFLLGQDSEQHGVFHSEFLRIFERLNKASDGLLTSGTAPK